MLDAFAPFKWEALFARWPEILSAFGTTVLISFFALILALVLGVIFGVLSVSRFAPLRAITRIYVEVVQNVPLLLQAFVFYALLPLIGINMETVYIGIFAIGIYHGGYISEVVRSGIGSIHRGQFEAAKSQGFSYWQSMFVIILPQAMRIILPPLAVQAANLVKNTSILAFFVGGEIMYFSNSFAGSTSYYGPVYLIAAVLYFIICFPLSRLALYLERRTRSHKHVTTGDATEHLATDPTEVTPGSHDITGHTAADSLAAGVQTMHETVDIAPAVVAPSPRHPLHVIVDPGDPDSIRRAYPLTGRRAAEIADEIGRELQQQIEDECAGDEACMRRKTRTKAGRTGAKRKLLAKKIVQEAAENPEVADVLAERMTKGALSVERAEASRRAAQEAAERANAAKQEAAQVVSEAKEAVKKAAAPVENSGPLPKVADGQAALEKAAEEAALGEEAFADNEFLADHIATLEKLHRSLGGDAGEIESGVAESDDGENARDIEPIDASGTDPEDAFDGRTGVGGAAGGRSAGEGGSAARYTDGRGEAK
ncbi:amino acid ABC transporter permease [Raoultibacter massiliensis]|uniref:amino acid ABC transporter permease n=1 Tax=Raoultibacter massiliensis TaxID=1852371 RepID=UPI003A900B57